MLFLRSLRSCLLPIAWLALSCVSGEAPEPLRELFPTGLEAYSVQMHVHGHSHHNGSGRPGSMQWHSHFAAANDLDVLWWSDHSEMFDLSSPLRFDFESDSPRESQSRQEHRQAGHLAADGLFLGLANAPPEDVEWIEAEDRRTPDRKRLVARSGARDDAFSETLYTIQRSKGSPKGFLLPRPVSSNAILSLDMRAGELTPDVRVTVEVRLSWHHRGAEGRQVLRYHLAPPTTAPVRSTNNAESVAITVPVPTTRAKVVFDLENDAALLEDGTDNTITGIRVRLASRRGVEASMEIFGLELSSRAPEPDHQLAQIRRFAARYESEYGHEQAVGVEFAAEGDRFVHLNAFLPDGALTGGLASGDETTWDDPAEFVRRVRSLGGVTSLNHLFGTAPGQGRLRRQQRKSRVRALELLEIGAYGTDILEVGYQGRGGVGLEYYLRTWDLLTARGLYLYGNGVSDTHGGKWGPDMRPNRFGTWIWSEGPQPNLLIDAIKRGRMVFGDPFAYSGKLYFRVGEAEMGDRVSVLEKEQILRVAVDEFFDPESHRLYLVQGRIRPATEGVLYMTGSAVTGYRREIGIDEPIVIDASEPCFLRLELYDVEGRPLLFSNPIVFDG